MTTRSADQIARAREIAVAISALVERAGYPLGMGVGFTERQIGMLAGKAAEWLDAERARTIAECAKIADRRCEIASPYAIPEAIRALGEKP